MISSGSGYLVPENVCIGAKSIILVVIVGFFPQNNFPVSQGIVNMQLCMRQISTNTEAVIDIIPKKNILYYQVWWLL